jgi:hypothetical protein
VGVTVPTGVTVGFGVAVGVGPGVQVPTGVGVAVGVAVGESPVSAPSLASMARLPNAELPESSEMVHVTV